MKESAHCHGSVETVTLSPEELHGVERLQFAAAFTENREAFGRAYLALGPPPIDRPSKILTGGVRGILAKPGPAR